MLDHKQGRLEGTVTKADADARVLNSAGTSGWKVEKWVTAVDPIRGIAALAVLIHHSWRQAYHEPLFPLGAWLGEWGVLLFFVLSGFCIHLPQASRNFNSNSTKVDWKRFFYRRARRLLPTHYASLALSAVTGLFITTMLIRRPTLEQVVAHILMVHVWYYPFYYSINAVFWSIAIEVQFYLAYPLFLAIKKRLGSIYPVAFFVLSFTFYGAVTVLFADSMRWQFVFRNLFIAHWWQWVLGAFLADFYVTGKATPVTAAFTFKLAPVLWGAASLALGFIDPIIAHIHWNLWISPVLCVLFLGSAVLSSWWPRMRPLEYVGAFSYSLYLIHPVAIALFLGVFGVWRGFSALLIYVTVSLLLSWLFFLAIERPFLSQRQVTHAVLRT